MAGDFFGITVLFSDKIPQTSPFLELSLYMIIFLAVALDTVLNIKTRPGPAIQVLTYFW